MSLIVWLSHSSPKLPMSWHLLFAETKVLCVYAPPMGVRTVVTFSLMRSKEIDCHWVSQLVLSFCYQVLNDRWQQNPSQPPVTSFHVFCLDERRTPNPLEGSTQLFHLSLNSIFCKRTSCHIRAPSSSEQHPSFFPFQLIQGRKSIA